MSIFGMEVKMVDSFVCLVLAFSFLVGWAFYELLISLLKSKVLRLILRISFLLFAANVFATSLYYSWAEPPENDQEMVALWQVFTASDYSCTLISKYYDFDDKWEYWYECDGEVFQRRDKLLRERGIVASVRWSDSGQSVAFGFWWPF